jgi:hypothetical protein
MGFRAVGRSVKDPVTFLECGRRTLLLAIESYQSRQRLLAYFEAHM